MTRLIIGTSIIVILSFLSPLYTLGAAYTDIVVFGDSTSDNGTSGDDIWGFQRYTNPNGKVWVEYLAEKLKCNLDDRAYGGATTGYNNIAGYNIFGTSWQVDDYLSAQPGYNQETTLYIIAAGANDFYYAQENNWQPMVTQAINNLAAISDKLSDAGAKNYLILNMSDLSLIPYYSEKPWTADITNAFNTQGYAALLDSKSRHPGVNGTYVDLYSFANNLFYSGIFENVTDVMEDHPEAYDSINPSDENFSYLYWDDLHTTTTAHRLFGDYVASQVPIPAAVWLLGSGLIGLVGIRRRFNK